jgi:hypothetical protein
MGGVGAAASCWDIQGAEENIHKMEVLKKKSNRVMRLR